MSDLITVVYEDGTLVPRERISPSIAQFIAQMTTTSQLIKMRKLEESKIPIGIKTLRHPITDTLLRLILTPPWISLSLINDGPGAITVWVNVKADSTLEGMIPSGEVLNIDMGYPVIHTLYLKAEAGNNALARIYGKEGIPST